MRYSASTLSKIVLFIGIFGASLFSCKARKVSSNPSTGVVADTMTLVSPSDTSTQNVIAIKDFYGRTCGQCHKLYKPQDYNAVEWRDNLNKMQKRAMISDQNKEDLFVYLTTATN